MEKFIYINIISELDVTYAVTHILILLCIVVGLICVRCKKSDNLSPLKTLITNSIISYNAIVLLLGYSKTLMHLDIKTICFFSFFVGLAADPISDQIVDIMTSVNLRKVLALFHKKSGEILDDSDDKGSDKYKDK